MKRRMAKQIPKRFLSLLIIALFVLAVSGIGQTISDPPPPSCVHCGAKATRRSDGGWTIKHKEGCKYAPRSSSSSGDAGKETSSNKPLLAPPRPVESPFEQDKKELLKRLRIPSPTESSFDEDRRDLLGNLKGTTPAEGSFDADKADLLGRLKGGATPVSAEIAAALEELAAMSPETMANERSLIAQRLVPPNPWSNAIARSLKAKVPPLPPKAFDQLQIGDVLLVAPRDDISFDAWTGHYIRLADKLTSWDSRSRASHALLFVREVKGVKLFLDNNPGQGSRTKTEEQVLAEYAGRGMDVARPRGISVAQPVSKLDADKLWAAAREQGIKGLAEYRSKADNWVDTTDFGIFGDDNMVCSETARWALMKAGLDIPETRSPIKKLIGIYFGLANFYTDEQTFLVTPLEQLPVIKTK